MTFKSLLELNTDAIFRGQEISAYEKKRNFSVSQVLINGIIQRLTGGDLTVMPNTKRTVALQQGGMFQK